MGIKTSFDHLKLYVSDRKISFKFYKELLTYLGYNIIEESETSLGMRNKPTDIWLKEVSKENKSKGYYNENIGLNHLAFGVSKKEDVDKFHQEFLIPQGIKPLYDSPKPFPEYTERYYAVFFEDPDRIKLEIVFL